MASKSTYNRPASNKKPAKPKTPLYSWGDGNGKIHTIPLATHQDNVKLKQYGFQPGQSLADPLSPANAIAQSEAAADVKYGPQIFANQELQRATPQWYQNYVNQSIGRQQAAQQYAAQSLAPLAQAATAQPQLPPGLDPNSPEAQKAQQAGQAGQTMNQASYASLAAIPAALNAYLAGAQDAAQRDLPGARAYLQREGASLKSQRGEYATQQLGDLRTNAQNYSIASQTLGLNKAKSQADIDLQRGIDPVTGKRLPSDPEKPITSGPFAGLTGSKVNAMTSEQRQTAIDNYNKAVHPPKTPKDPNALTPSEQRAEARRKERHKNDVAAATGKLRSKISDIIDYRQPDVGGTTEDRSKQPDVFGNYPTRKVTQKDIDAEKRRKYGKLGEIALAVRDGKKLTQDQVDYLHGLDQDIRIPSEWLPTGYKKTPAQRANPHATGRSGNTRAPHGAHGHI